MANISKVNIDGVDYNIKDAAAIEILQTKPGQKTEQGEIFNDYENNVAQGAFSHAEGLKTTVVPGLSLAETDLAYVSFVDNVLTLSDASAFLADNIAQVYGFHIKNKGKEPFTDFCKVLSYEQVENNWAFTIETPSENLGLSTANEFTIDVILIDETVVADSQHVEGYDSQASGPVSHAEGQESLALGNISHAEGWGTIAAGRAAHTEGWNTKVIKNYGHAEGTHTIAGYNAHAEGAKSKALGQNSHAEGTDTMASGAYSHAEGYETESEGWHSHSEGHRTKSIGEMSHAEGDLTLAEGKQSHAEGNSTVASNLAAHAEGTLSVASGINSHAQNYKTVASGDAAHSEGRETEASGDSAHAEGKKTKALNEASHAEGAQTIASGINSHAEGIATEASGDYSHAENYNTAASGNHSHAEGLMTFADNDAAHAEGRQTRAKGQYSHSEGRDSLAEGAVSHAEGSGTKALGAASHAEGGLTIANNAYSHAEGLGTRTGVTAQSVKGKYNVGKTNTLVEVGNGTGKIDEETGLENRANAFEVYEDGHAEVQVQGTTDNSVVINKTLKNYATKKDLDTLQGEVTENKNNIVTLQSNIQQITHDIGPAGLAGDMQHLYGEITENKNNIVTLQGEVANLTKVHVVTELPDAKTFLEEHPYITDIVEQFSEPVFCGTWENGLGDFYMATHNPNGYDWYKIDFAKNNEVVRCFRELPDAQTFLSQNYLVDDYSNPVCVYDSNEVVQFYVAKANYIPGSGTTFEWEKLGFVKQQDMEWELIEDINLTEAVVEIALPVDKMNTMQEIHIEGYIIPTDTSITNQTFSINDGSNLWLANCSCKATGKLYLIMDIYKSPRNRAIFDGTMSAYYYTLAGSSFKTFTKSTADGLADNTSSDWIIGKNTKFRSSEANPMAAGTHIKIWGR